MKTTYKDAYIEVTQQKDYAAIASIYNEYISAGQATMHASIHTAENIKGWVDHFTDREVLYSLKRANEVIGWGVIRQYSDREGYYYACDTAIYLTRSELSKGYGSFLKKFVIEQCKKLDYRHLVAKIWAKNKVSIEYNLKLGYTIVGTQNKVGFRNGEWLDVVIMQLLL